MSAKAVNMENAHTPSDNMQGWLRLGLSLVAWAAAFFAGFGQIKANLEAQTTATHELSAEVKELRQAVSSMAINAEGVKHDVADMKQSMSEVKARVDRLEDPKRRP